MALNGNSARLDRSNRIEKGPASTLYGSEAVWLFDQRESLKTHYLQPNFSVDGFCDRLGRNQSRSWIRSKMGFLKVQSLTEISGSFINDNPGGHNGDWLYGFDFKASESPVFQKFK